MIIGGKVTNPGELRTRVVLAPRTVSTETGGFRRPHPDSVNQVNAWAKWVNAHGNEAWTANAEGILEPATVLMRYRSDIDASWYISKDNGATWFEIVSPDNIQERGEYLELKVKRWRQG